MKTTKLCELLVNAVLPQDFVVMKSDFGMLLAEHLAPWKHYGELE